MPATCPDTNWPINYKLKNLNSKSSIRAATARIWPINAWRDGKVQLPPKALCGRNNLPRLAENTGILGKPDPGYFSRRPAYPTGRVCLFSTFHFASGYGRDCADQVKATTSTLTFDPRHHGRPNPANAGEDGRHWVAVRHMLDAMSKAKVPEPGRVIFGEQVHRISHAVGLVENVIEAKAGWPPEIT